MSESSSSTSNNREIPRSCLFCLLRKTEEDPKGQILARQGDLMVVADVNPAATRHFVVHPHFHPKGDHYDDMSMMGSEEVPMVRRMEEYGLKFIMPQIGDFRKSELLVGAFVPEMVTIKHFNVHFVYPVSEFSHLSKMRFKPENFLSIDQIDKLLTRKGPRRGLASF